MTPKKVYLLLPTNFDKFRQKNHKFEKFFIVIILKCTKNKSETKNKIITGSVA